MSNWWDVPVPGQSNSNSSGGGSGWGDLFKTLAPLIATAVAAKVSPSPSDMTKDQNATALANLPPELKDMLTMAAQNAKAAQPLYLNGIAAQNRLLPAWARGNAVTGAVPGSTSGGGTMSGINPTSSKESILKDNPSGYLPGGNGMSEGGKSPMSATGNDFPIGGMAGAEGTGTSGLDPRMVLFILSLLSGNPVPGMISKALPNTSNGTGQPGV